MRKALNILGLGPTHHMYEVNEHPEQKRLWRDAVHRGFRDWNRLFEGYNACIDWPSAMFWCELMHVYPDAKIILTWRTPESWWRSFERTILPSTITGTDPDAASVAIRRDVFDNLMEDREHAIAVYNANVAAVREHVPPERLLVHELGDGWEPICAAFGKPVPDEPYPSGNTAEVFNKAVQEEK